jgi:hypothetical protein
MLTKSRKGQITVNRITLVFLMMGISMIAIACESSSPPTTNTPSSTISPSPVSGTNTSSASPIPVPISQAKAGFNEETYLLFYPDVAEQIKAGKFKSALEHYEKVGKFGKNAKGENYESTFAGTSGSDTVEGLGSAYHSHFIGVSLTLDPKNSGEDPTVFGSLGQGEIDTLIGNREGENEFILGSYITSANPKAEPFYISKGDDDYARVQNFKKGRDAVYLSGSLNDYKLESANGTVRISTVKGDLVAIIEGIDKLEFGKISQKYGQFSFK